jgi:hypothetical protein
MEEEINTSLYEGCLPAGPPPSLLQRWALVRPAGKESGEEKGPGAGEGGVVAAGPGVGAGVRLWGGSSAGGRGRGRARGGGGRHMFRLCCYCSSLHHLNVPQIECSSNHVCIFLSFTLCAISLILLGHW